MVRQRRNLEGVERERNIRRNEPQQKTTRCLHNSRPLKCCRGYDDICSSLALPWQIEPFFFVFSSFRLLLCFLTPPVPVVIAGWPERWCAMCKCAGFGVNGLRTARFAIAGDSGGRGSSPFGNMEGRGG